MMPAGTRRSHRLLPLFAAAALLLAALPARAETAWVAEFNDTKGWESVWRFAPAELKAVDGKLHMVSPAEGSSAVAATTPVLDLNRFRYIVVRVTDIGGEGDGAHQFRISLNRVEGGKQVDRVDGIRSAFPPDFADPTLIVIDLHAMRVKWRGNAAINIEVQACYAQTRIGVDFVKIVDALTPQEQADWDTTRERILGPRPLPFHGLKEMASRRGWIHAPYFTVAAPEGAATPDVRPMPTQPYYEAGKRYLSDRLIYSDSVTHMPVWKLTRYPYMEQKYYMNRMHWNADGSILRWHTNRGGSTQWFMDANATNLRSWETGIPDLDEKTGVRSFCWDENDPKSFYYMVADGTRRTVYRFNIETGEKVQATSIEMVKGAREFKVHPDGKHFLFCEPQGSNTSDDAQTLMYVSGPEGLLHRFLVKSNVQDKTNFTGAPDLSLWVVVTRPRAKRGGWLMNVDGSNAVHFQPLAGHDDWTGDGGYLVGYFQNAIYAESRDGKVTKTLVDLRTGGHLGAALDDRSLMSDVGHNGPWSDSILYLDAVGGWGDRVCMASSSYTGHSAKHNYHPYIHSNHPHASMSPDGTKGLFESDYMGVFSDVYMVVTRTPDAPRDVKVDGGTLRWSPGMRHRETKGYIVYRAEQSGGPYARVNDVAVAATQMPVKADGFYVVTAVENSDLESVPSPEVCAAKQWTGRVRILVEAEQCALGDDVQPRVCGEGAGGLYGAGLRDGIASAALAVQVNVPKEGTYHVLARIRRPGEVSTGGYKLSTKGEGTAKWTWARIGTYRFGAGKRSVEVRLAGEMQIDQFLLTDEVGFDTEAPMVRDTVDFSNSDQVAVDRTPPSRPVDPRARVLDPFTVRLAWKGSQSADVAHYNVYCGTAIVYEATQAHRVGSPSELAFVDWGLKAGTTYHYKITAVDRAGNESTPVSVVATTGKARIVALPFEAEDATLNARAEQIEDIVADNGKAVRFPVGGDPGEIMLKFDVPVAGEYAIWAHAHQINGNADPMVVSLDENQKMLWRLRVAPCCWGWDFVGGTGKLDKKKYNRNDGHATVYPLLLQLEKGAHTLKIAGSQGRAIDRLVVTNNPAYERNGFESLRGGQ